MSDVIEHGYPRAGGLRGEEMRTPDDVSAMVRLKALGWGTKRIASELGCSRNTVKRWLRAGGWRRGVRHCIFKLTLSGAGWFADRSGEYAVPEQHGFLCRLDDPSIRYGYPEGASEPWRFVFLAFYTAPELVDELLARHGPIYPLPPDAPVVEALLACERHPAEPMELAAGEAAALVHGLLQAFADAHTHAAADTAAAQLVRAARRAIREAPNAALNVSELAAGLGVSPEHLGRVFRRETGATPLRTILRRRMRLAAEWLVDDGLSVKETAARLGYDTPSHFARAFRRVTGVAPRDYRRNPGLGVW